MALRNYATEEELIDYVTQEYDSDTYTVQRLLTTDMNGVFGIPYQFMKTVDRRLSSTEIGRKYAEKIVSRLPLLFMSPCTQVFMEDFNSTDSSSVANYLIGSATGTSDGDVSSLVSGTGKYYTTQLAYDDYYSYVNVMCQTVAMYLGIGDEVVSIGSRTSALRTFTWQSATSSAFKSFFSSSENVVFYLDGMTEVSESFSNSTTESSLASTINGYSDQVREIQFLLGGSDSNSLASSLATMGTEVTESLTSSLSGLVGTLGGGLLSSLCDSGVSTILTGGKIVFPEIWSDSQYERDYSLNIKLRSPDHDSLSIYLNILVPYMHLLAFVMPHGLSSDPNGYTSPFLVRAFCKGMFNVDMGMVTSMSVTKGAECCWNDDGLPTQIDVSLSISDLYSSLYMSNYDNVASIVKNTDFINWLANMAGLNVGQMGIGRRTELYNYLIVNKIATTPSRLYTRFTRSISNLMLKLYNKF